MLISSFVERFRRSAAPAVDVVDDPSGGLRIVRLRGRVTAPAMLDLLDAAIGLESVTRVHLDLIDARITGAWAMHALERAVDDVEGNGVSVRVVGLDPHHPALGC